jgi:putative DNA primase/helicase
MACGEHGGLRTLAAKLGIGADNRPSEDRIAATYDYRVKDSALLYQTVRLRNPKDFFQRRPDGGGGWINNLKGVRRVPYRLPDVLASGDAVVIIVEGEKDADRLAALGLVATTNVGGASKWRDEYSEHLRGRRVAILPDNDDAGRAHSEQVARSLHGVAGEVCILDLPGLPEKGDVSDWLDAGGTVVELQRLAKDAPGWTASADDDVSPAAETDDEPPRTDAGNGELYARLYGDRVRYDHRRRRWLTWAGQWWTDDADGETRRLAKLTARYRFVLAPRIEDLTLRAAATRFAIASESRQRIDAMLTQAQTEPPVADAGTGWDQDPMLLAVANGVVDLRTGVLRAGRREDRITLHTNIRFDSGAECPRWLAFLDEVFGGDQELIDFIWRAAGYSLTGLTREQCMFLCYGKGSNGKSVLLSVLRAIAGRYAFNAPFSTFELQRGTSIPNDVAAMAGRRLVTSSETNEGTRLNEARIKALTGCDPMTARFLHAEWFTFEPVAKFWLAVNHKPDVADDSHGFWRRVRLIPFIRQFADSKADRDLDQKLRAELPGILAWAVRGALEWQQRGLPPPEVVRNATEGYRTESDPLWQFIKECCVLGARHTIKSTHAFRAYQAWCATEGMGEREMLTSTKFGKRMSARFERKHTNSGNVYAAVGLLSEHADPGGDDGPDEVKGSDDADQHADAADDAKVKGSVKGCEPEDQENEVFSLDEALTRKNPEKPFTTLHSFTPPGDEPEPCAVCRWRAAQGKTDFGTPVCGMHAAQHQQMERRRARTP